MKQCPKCKSEFDSRKKFCSDACKYWFNVVKKEKESLLAPFKKRNDKWFYMVIGSEYKSKDQGKRVNGMIKGGMSARIASTVEVLVEVNKENIDKHFKGIPGYIPDYIRLGNQERIYKQNLNL